MSRPTMEQIRQMGSFVTTYQWNFNIITPPSAIANFPALATINARAQSSAVPSRTNEKIEINLKGHKVSQGGPITYNSPLSVTFVETSDNAIFNMIRLWTDAVTETNTGAHGDKLAVEAVVDLQLLARDDTPLQSYLLFGVFPEANTPAELGSEGGDLFTNAIDFHYDYFKMNNA